MDLQALRLGLSYLTSIMAPRAPDGSASVPSVDFLQTDVLITEAIWTTSRTQYEEVNTDPYSISWPTWDTLTRAVRIAPIYFTLQDANRFGEVDRVFAEHTNVIANRAVAHRHATAPVDIGGGMDHLTAILHHAQEAKAAGRKWPLVIMRDTDGQLLDPNTCLLYTSPSPRDS